MIILFFSSSTYKNSKKETCYNLNDILGGNEFLEDIESAVGVSLKLPEPKKKQINNGLAAARKRKKTESQELRDRLSVS